MKLTVIIVSYNVCSYVEQCLISVRRALAGIDGEVIVVDNNSTDNTVERVRERFPEVQIIENKENTGFSRANNQAICICQGEYVLLLNPDTIVGENSFRDCISFMDSKPDAGICGVMMLRADGTFAPESRRGVPTPFTAFCKMSGLGSLFPKSRTFGRYYMRYLDENEASEIDIVSGAFMFIRKATLDKIGLLDETFFMYGEDIDLSYRALLAGYKNYYVPTPILHYKGESTKKASMSYINAFHRAMIIFFRKHFGRSNWLYVALVKMAVVAKGAMTFVCNKLSNMHLFNGNEQPDRMLLIGEGDNLEKMAAVAKRNGCNFKKINEVRNFENFFETVDNIEIFENFKTFDYVVFDTSRYPFTSILEFFRHCQHHVYIGTYIPQSSQIITLQGVLK